MIFLFELLITGYIFIVGSCIGSFLNVVAWRAPRGLSPARGRSFCPACGAPIRAYDLLPVVSFLVLRGKCRRCGAKIPLRDFLVEGLMGVAALAVCDRFGFSWAALLAFLFLCLLLLVALIDQDTMTIPDPLVLCIAAVGLASLLVWDIPLKSRVIGAFCISLPMLLLTLCIDGAFGGGDIKLMIPCGFLLGWQATLLAGFLAVLTCGGLAIYLLAAKKLERGGHLPFGPYLSLGCGVALLYAGPILNWYFSLWGL